MTIVPERPEPPSRDDTPPGGMFHPEDLLTFEVEQSLRALGVTTRDQAATVLDAAPLALTADQRECVLGALDGPQGNYPRSGVIFPLGPGLSGPGGPVGDPS